MTNYSSLNEHDLQVNYDRLYSTTQHYESLIYTSSGPIFAICITLFSISAGAGDFAQIVQIAAMLGGMLLSFIAFITVEKLRAYINAMTKQMKTIEQITNLGVWRDYRTIYNQSVWSQFPSNMRMRAWLFGIISMAFIALAALETVRFLAQ